MLARFARSGRQVPNGALLLPTRVVENTDVNDRCDGRLNLLQGRLVESHAAVNPLDDCVLFVSSLNCAEFSGRLSEVAQTLDAISGVQFLAGGRGLGKRWSLGTLGVRNGSNV